MSNFNILAIDTAVNSCSAALLYNGKLHENVNLPSKNKSTDLLNIINVLLQDLYLELDQISAFAFSAGPGSLTGLKIASSIIQALNLVYNKSIIKISTLQALALQAYEEFGAEYIIPCIDAKMGQVYYGYYKIMHFGDYAIPTAIQDDALCSTENVKILDPKGLSRGLIVGNGSKLLDLAGNKHIELLDCYNTAKFIAKIANYIYINYDKTNNDAIPFYLRLYE